MREQIKIPKKAGRRADKRKRHSAAAFKLGQRIKALRGDRSLEDVERELNGVISNQAISNIENGYTNPNDKRTKRTLRLLADYYENDFELDWLKAERASIPQNAPSINLELLPASLFTEETLKEVPDGQIIDYYHVMVDAYHQIVAMLEKEIKHRGLEIPR